MSLVHAELRRLFKRRFTWWMLATVVLLLAMVATIVALHHQKPGPDALAQAQAQAQREYAEQQRRLERDILECERLQAGGGAVDDPGGYHPEDCAEMRQWQSTEEEMVEWFMPPSFDFREGFPAMIMVLVGLLAMFAFIVGASFVGAEWRSGGMMNLLLWRPRRLQVFGAKLGTLLGTLLGLGVVLGALWTGAMWLVAVFRGVTGTMTSGAWQSFGLTGLRGLTLVLVAGAVGFALASVGRHTAMALGFAIASFVVGVVGVGIVVALAQVKYPEAWLWPTYLTAWMDKSVVLEDWGACSASPGPCEPPTLEITWQVSGVALAAAAAVVIGAAMWHMRQRDIT